MNDQWRLQTFPSGRHASRHLVDPFDLSHFVFMAWHQLPGQTEPLGKNPRTFD